MDSFITTEPRKHPGTSYMIDRKAIALICKVGHLVISLLNSLDGIKNHALFQDQPEAPLQELWPDFLQRLLSTADDDG